MTKGTKKTMIFSLVLMLVSGSIFGFMVYQVTAQGDRLISQVSVLEEERAQESSHFRLQSLASETEDERETLNSYFLAQESDSIDFLNYVERIAEQSGISLSTENLSAMEEDDGSRWINTTFAFESTQTKVETFVKALETLPYVSRVTRLELGSNSTGVWQATVTVQVRILDYDQ